MTDFAGHRVATAAKTNMASLYDITGRWDKAIAELASLKDSSGTIPLSATMQIAEIAGFHKGDLDTAMTIYNELAAQLTGPDTVFLPVIMFKQSMIHLEKKRFGQARSVLTDLSDRFPGYFNSNATAQLIKARSFDLEGNWARAETEYRFLIENYTGSDEAMSTHLYLEKHYADDGRQTEADRWFDRSVQHFDLLAGRGGVLGAKALTYKAELYRQRKMWPEAASALEHLYTGFPDSRLGQKAILTAAALYKERLDKPEVADSLIEVFKRTQTETDQEPE
jgi:tetratricopeptide (TPR) repeat protein